jgi:hypothetical protein
MLSQIDNRVPQQIFTWALRHETWLRRRLQRAALRAAQAQAFACFAEEHPLWAESLFDQYFLSHHAASLVARALDPANRPTPFEFAEAWFTQCAAPGTTAQDADMAEVAMVALAFLRHLDAALQPYQAILR